MTDHTGASATQVGGTHYKALAIEPWDIIVANGCGYFDGNVIKYVLRFRAKNGVEDLKKARHYLDKLIEIEERREATCCCGHAHSADSDGGPGPCHVCACVEWQP